MDPLVKKIFEKTAEYIETTQPLIDKQNEDRATFVKRATQVAGVLAHRGVLDRNQVDNFVDKVAADPAAVWAVVEKLANQVVIDTLVDSGREKVADAAESSDPFERRLFGDNNARSSGLIEE